jgi:PAS domain S-box-containing protein
MKRWFLNLKISQKLALISILFVMPDSVMLYLFITAINANIHFARLEQKGNEYQRPLEDLLELVPLHGQLALQALAGDPSAFAALPAKETQIDKTFGALEEVDARIGGDLQFTDEGLAKRKRERARVTLVRAEWNYLAGHLKQLTPAECADRHAQLIEDIRLMITHAGDMSNLILDPILDTYYMIDATLMAMPQTQDRMAEMTAYGQSVLNQPTLGHDVLRKFAIYAKMLKEDDLDRITDSVHTSMNENPNEFGFDDTLNARVQPALGEYIAATQKFVDLTSRAATSPTAGPATEKEYIEAGNAASKASFTLWRIADQELDKMLEIRIESYQWRRTRSLFVAAGALMAAIGFVTFITRSISGPLRRQANELQTANDALQAEIAERKRMEAALRTAEEQYRSIFENAVEGIFQTTADGRYLVANPTLARIYGYDSVDELKASVTDIGNSLYVKPGRRAEFQRLIEQSGEIHQFDSEIYRKDGSIIWISEHARAAYDDAGKLLYYEGTVEDITERKRSEELLERLNIQLRDTSRRAGMAEVATGVLHNVGNVLNSVNVSALLITDRLSKSRVSHLMQVSTVLRENAANLGTFITEDPKGSKIPAFIASLAERLSGEQAELLREAEGLSKNIAHIKDIVAVQQNYAKVSGVVEVLPAASLVEDALEMNGAAFGRHRVEVVRAFEEVPPVRVEKHKVLQILINVIRNAKYAVSESRRQDKRISVSIHRNGNNCVKIAVADNGIGIAPEFLTRIFAHGFTTKTDGHGFGLHCAALAAKEMGGSLTAQSEGVDQGATFILELPIATPASEGVLVKTS